MSSAQQPDWTETAIRALEMARRESLLRVTSAGLPTSVRVSHLVVRPHPGGWQSDDIEVVLSILATDEGMAAIRDDTVEHQIVGFHNQLQAFAEALDAATDLGSRPGILSSSVTGPDAVLVRYVVPMTIAYLTSLSDLAVPDELVARSFVEQLVNIAESPTVTSVRQLAVSGITVTEQIEHKGITIRPLNELERGSILEANAAGRLYRRPRVSTGFVPSSPFDSLVPSTLLEARTTRDRAVIQDLSNVMLRLALAFLLEGHVLASNGFTTQFDDPRWATSGISSSPVPILERVTTTDVPVSQDEFVAIVDLAEKIPDFSFNDGSTQEVVLNRALRGLGAENDAAGFLDCVIALEAALLGRDTNELAYRFRLYGSVFLREELDPEETFEQLKAIYGVRSKLVHGSVVKPEKRELANAYAQSITRALVRRAVTDGWPVVKKLDKLALR